MLLFPTRFFTEGIPGTIIDAYAAGVPILSAKWESYNDVVDEGETGISYEFGNIEDFERKLLIIKDNPEVITNMKKYAIKKAEDYIPESAIKVLIERL